MKQLLLSSIIILAAIVTVQAQQLIPTTISSGGSSKLAGGVLLEDNVGGLIVSTISTPAVMYTQGFIQPDAGTVTSLPPINDVVLSSGAGIDNGGATFISGNTMLEFTVGEVASKTLFGGTNMLTQGILQPYPGLITGLPVTNLEFLAKRMNTSTVQLNWKTEQELSNRGFSIERKKENETTFVPVKFTGSKAVAGTSYTPLSYEETDYNNFTGKTYYRLRQEDLDGQFKYSVIRLVSGNNSSPVIMQVWPVPANGPVNTLISGIKKTDQLLVFDATGKLVQRHTINNNQPLQLTGLRSGTYILKLVNNIDIVQKIVVQ